MSDSKAIHQLNKFVMSFLGGLLNFLSNSYIIFKFIGNTAGKEYGIGHLQKARLTIRVIQNRRKSRSLSSWQQHILLIEEIFLVPKSLRGEVVECGCFDGSSTVSLSLACALTHRGLIVCDSFEGLPRVKEDEKYDIQAHSRDYYAWEEGDFSLDHGLDGVKKNVETFGNIGICKFVKGYFKDTLKDIPTDSIVFIFEDVVLTSSVEDCLHYLWPRLQNGCKFYSHEPWSINVVSLFFDKVWWKNNLKMEPPGFWGSGYGLGAGLRPSFMGYAKKFDPHEIKEQGTRIVHNGLKMT